jgi:hypothetical protein
LIFPLVVASSRVPKHDPEKHALGLRPDGWSRFSEKIMLKNKVLDAADP